jgi:hypothetical protein
LTQATKVGAREGVGIWVFSITLYVDMHCACVVLYGGTVLYGNAPAEHDLKRKAYEKLTPTMLL